MFSKFRKSRKTQRNVAEEKFIWFDGSIVILPPSSSEAEKWQTLKSPSGHRIKERG